MHRTEIELAVASGALLCTSFLSLTSVEASQSVWKPHQWLKNGLKLSRMMRRLSGINAGIASGGARKETLKVYIWYCVYVCQMASNVTPSKNPPYLDIRESPLDFTWKRGGPNGGEANRSSFFFYERHQRKQQKQRKEAAKAAIIMCHCWRL